MTIETKTTAELVTETAQWRQPQLQRTRERRSQEVPNSIVMTKAEGMETTVVVTLAETEVESANQLKDVVAVMMNVTKEIPEIEARPPCDLERLAVKPELHP
jgi:transposase-like protein